MRQASRALAAAGRMLLAAVTLLAAPVAREARAEPFRFTRLVAHWADYADPGYLPFIDDARPEVAQVGFYGAHFWSLAATAHGGGYPANLPVRGHRECADFFERLNGELHRRGVKVVGHLNVKFLVGDPESPEGPRGFFKFYRDQWDTERLGPRPTAEALDLLEVDREGKPISNQTYSIGGMKEYWACLNNPAWREVLKAWLRAGIARGADGFVANYFYRHDCHCRHCVAAFRRYLGERFKPAELKERFSIEDLATHRFEEIGAWHDPAQSTPLRREALRFSQVANKQAFDEVFIAYGRSLKPDLIVAQWNHLGDFTQLAGDERCLLPDELWGRGEDYLWYSTGGATNVTDLKHGVLGEATLQARYLRGAFQGKPFTLGRYESVRIRSAIAELAANGGAPMGFYTAFKDPEARREIVRYYGFLKKYDALYHASRSHAESLLLYPRRSVHQGDVAAVARFKDLGRRLLDAHVLFDVLPDDRPAAGRAGYAAVFDPSDPSFKAEDLEVKLPRERSAFEAARAVRVSASRPAGLDEITLHFVNYDRREPADPKDLGHGITDEKPLAAPGFAADILLPGGFSPDRIEFLTPEEEEPRVLAFERKASRVKLEVPSFLVYGVLRLKSGATAETYPPAATRNVAALVTEYRHNSHADVIVSRLLLTDTLDGKGKVSPLKLVSLYADQRPANDLSRPYAASHGFRTSETIEDALTLGTGRLAVDGVLLIAEHGNYPRSATGNTVYPKRRFWEEVLKVFRASGRAVPVFIDKHLADNWTDAKYIYDTARELKVPLLAGSSLPGTWRRPPADVPRGAPLKEIVAITYHTTDAYGFHALEFAQALAEQRAGGETGLRAVQSFAGEAVWRAFEEKSFDMELFEAAWKRLSSPPDRARLKELVREPRLFRLEYGDGLRTHLLELNGAAGEWSAAWRSGGEGGVQSCLFWTQEGRPAMHFTWLLHGIEKMVLTGEPPWNVERTLLTSGALDALLLSLKEGQRRVETPYLQVSYQTRWRWSEPPPPPAMRPWSEP